MRISIDHNGTNIAEFNQLIVSGREALGGYAFNFSLKGSRKASDKPMKVSELSLSLSLSDPVRPFIVAIPLASHIMQFNIYANNTEQQNFEVILTKEQLNALEEYRKEGDLALKIGLKTITEDTEKQWQSYSEDVVVIPKQQWLEALGKTGFRQTLLFEVPLPDVSSEIMSLISKAQSFIEHGHYKDAVMQCRHIIEQIEELRNDKALSSTANKKAQDNQQRKEMTSIERLLSMREQIKNVCQLGAHGGEEFTRSQAKTVLGVTLSLLSEPTVGFSDTFKAKEMTG